METALLLAVILGVLAFAAERLLRRWGGPPPEEPDRGVWVPWWDPPWWAIQDQEEEEDRGRWPWDPLAPHPFDPFEDDRDRR